eukprot:TRINITY_DN23429_c0_g1_i1.p1 TRINITY_DN23429_c0_g1~~TRINITY_DN23429_c0_g1_i1.p1  ORF type:complete len:200 (-),score=10.60 TRINITY_DN23429_c0_g1_i1:40-639(-)
MNNFESLLLRNPTAEYSVGPNSNVIEVKLRHRDAAVVISSDGDFLTAKNKLDATFQVGVPVRFRGKPIPAGAVIDYTFLGLAGDLGGLRAVPRNAFLKNIHEQSVWEDFSPYVLTQLVSNTANCRGCRTLLRAKDFVVQVQGYYQAGDFLRFNFCPKSHCILEGIRRDSMKRYLRYPPFEGKIRLFLKRSGNGNDNKRS